MLSPPNSSPATPGWVSCLYVGGAAAVALLLATLLVAIFTLAGINDVKSNVGGSSSSCFEPCNPITQADIPLVISTPGAYCVVEPLSYDADWPGGGYAIRLALAHPGGTVDVHMQGYQLTLGNNTRGIQVYGPLTDGRVHHGIVAAHVQVPSSAVARGVQAENVNTCQFDHLVFANLSFSATAFINGNVSFTNLEIHGSSVWDPADGEHAGIFTATRGTVTVTDVTFDFPVAEGLQQWDPVLTTYGIYLTRWAAGACLVSQVTRVTGTSHTPITVDCTSKGSFVVDSYFTGSTSEASPATFFQANLFDDNALSHLTIDNVHIVGTAQTTANSAGFGSYYNLDMVINRFIVEPYVGTNFYWIASPSSNPNLNYDRRTLSVRNSDFFVSYTGRGLELYADPALGTSIDVSNSLVSGYGAPSVWVKLGLDRTVFDSGCQITGAHVGLQVENGADGTRLSNSFVDNCCTGATINVGSTNNQLINSVFFNNDVHVTDNTGDALDVGNTKEGSLVCNVAVTVARTVSVAATQHHIRNPRDLI
jgi:hypothetical protein